MVNTNMEALETKLDSLAESIEKLRLTWEEGFRAVMKMKGVSQTGGADSSGGRATDTGGGDRTDLSGLESPGEVRLSADSLRTGRVTANELRTSADGFESVGVDRTEATDLETPGEPKEVADGFKSAGVDRTEATDLETPGESKGVAEGFRSERLISGERRSGLEGLRGDRLSTEILLEVARRDEFWGETPCAFVSLKEGLMKKQSVKEIMEYCRFKLPPYRVHCHWGLFTGAIDSILSEWLGEGQMGSENLRGAKRVEDRKVVWKLARDRDKNPIIWIWGSNFLLDDHDQLIVGNIRMPYLLLGIPLLDSEMAFRLGTPNYIASEQWEPEVRGPISLETDSWGFGCSIVEMLIGIQPWLGKTVDEIFWFVPYIPSGLPPVVENVINGCFEYDLRNRLLMLGILHAFESSQNVVHDDGNGSGFGEHFDLINWRMNLGAAKKLLPIRGGSEEDYSVYALVEMPLVLLRRLSIPIIEEMLEDHFIALASNGDGSMEALKRKLQARIEYAKFLQDTVKEMAKEVQNSRSGETKKTAKDLDEFLNKVRRGAGVSNKEILGFAKLFNDELTLYNISKPRLVNMCKYMGISPFGTDAYLRYMLRKRLQWIKNDDKLIQAEGVESLSEAELREDCRERGMFGLLSVEEMRQQLRDWLDLSLNHSVPSSLLILSRAFTVSGKMKPEDAVRATLSSLPDEVVGTVGVTALPSEDSVSERRRKLEYLEMQDELIKEEEEKEDKELAKMKEFRGSLQCCKRGTRLQPWGQGSVLAGSNDRILEEVGIIQNLVADDVAEFSRM